MEGAKLSALVLSSFITSVLTLDDKNVGNKC